MPMKRKMCPEFIFSVFGDPDCLNCDILFEVVLRYSVACCPDLPRG